MSNPPMIYAMIPPAALHLLEGRLLGLSVWSPVTDYAELPENLPELSASRAASVDPELCLSAAEFNERFTGTSTQSVVTRRLYVLVRCSIVLVHLSMSGGMLELVFAKQMGIPVVGISPEAHHDELVIHHVDMLVKPRHELVSAAVASLVAIHEKSAVPAQSPSNTDSPR